MPIHHTYTTKLTAFQLLHNIPPCGLRQWWRVWLLPVFAREIERFEVQGQPQIYDDRLCRSAVSRGEYQNHPVMNLIPTLTQKWRPVPTRP